MRTPGKFMQMLLNYATWAIAVRSAHLLVTNRRRGDVRKDGWDSSQTPERLARLYCPGRHGVMGQMMIYGGMKNGRLYGQKFWGSVERLTDFLERASEAGLVDVLRVAGHERRQIAFDLKTSDASKFGEQRDDGFWSTPINLFYKTTATMAFLHNLQQNPAMYGTALRRMDNEEWEFVGQMPSGREVGLTRMAQDEDQSRFLGTGWQWVHPSNDKEVMDHLQSLFEAAKAPLPGGSEDLPSLYERTGRLHWWLAHRCYFFRGSAAVSEMLTAALFRLHGYQHPGYRKMPDVVALSTPNETQYFRHYHRLLRSVPKRLRDKGR